MKKPSKRMLRLRIDTIRTLSGLRSAVGALPTNPATDGNTGCQSEAGGCDGSSRCGPTRTVGGCNTEAPRCTIA